MDTINSDVVVVGAGLAGFTAAVRAAEAGASVLLIDKSAGEFGDGNVLMASEVSAPAGRVRGQIPPSFMTSSCPKAWATRTW